ncbi:MAG TPA: DUF502 domain-containing protein [Phycisphaerales bacterium]|nr:DUF502 domain-containing protein [Phycisphaerales bacterium]HMP38204.1 DUF502 domain-containing protein [Phycisphaerales bacterium]
MSHGPSGAPRSSGGDFKRFFLRGLAVLLPSVLTLWILVYAYRFVDGYIAEPINGGIRTAMAFAADRIEPLREQFDPSPETLAAELAKRPVRAAAAERAVNFELRKANIDAWWAQRWWMNIIGLAVAVVVVYTFGRLLRGWLGRIVYRAIERVFTSVPVVRTVYPAVKQVVDFLISAEDRPIRFSRVVAIEYPRPGIWSVGLVTGEVRTAVSPQGIETVSIFIPSSPTPFTGYTITVPRKDIRELPITVEQALKFVVSGGVLRPEVSPHATRPDFGAAVAAGREGVPSTPDGPMAIRGPEAPPDRAIAAAPDDRESDAAPAPPRG